MFRNAFNHSIDYFAHFLAIFMVYGFTVSLLKMLSLEDRPFAYTSTGKVLAGLFCVLLWAVIASLIYLWMRDLENSYVTFIVGVIVCPFALYRAYSDKKHDKV